MEKPKSGLTKGRIVLLVLLLLGGSGLGNVLAVLTPTIDNTAAQFTSMTSENFYMSGATQFQIPIIGAGGLLAGDADLTFVGGDTLTTTNISTSSLYVNSDLYGMLDGSVQNYTAWIESEIAAGTSSSLELDSTPNSDHGGNGLFSSMTVGENVVIGDALYMKNDGKLWKADANATATMPVVAIALGSINANNAGDVLKTGFIRDDSWSWTVGQLIYASGTAGALSQTAPNTSGDQVQVLGYAVTTHVIYFNPSYVLVEIV